MPVPIFHRQLLIWAASKAASEFTSYSNDTPEAKLVAPWASTSMLLPGVTPSNGGGHHGPLKPCATDDGRGRRAAVCSLTG